MQLGFFGSEISSIVAPNQLNYSLLSSILTQIIRLSISEEYGKYGGPVFHRMQYCILRVIRSNFLRGHEQLKESDDVGLIYFPLNPSSVAEKPSSSSSYVIDIDRGRERSEEGINDLNHLLVFQLLRSVLQSISGMSPNLTQTHTHTYLCLYVYIYINGALYTSLRNVSVLSIYLLALHGFQLERIRLINFIIQLHAVILIHINIYIYVCMYVCMYVCRIL